MAHSYLAEAKKSLRETRGRSDRGTYPGCSQPGFALAQKKTTNYSSAVVSSVVIMPSRPFMMMVFDPFRMMFVPPIAVVPRMMIVPIAVGAAPISMPFGPFRMMPPDPSGVIVVPPVGIVPRMMPVPITIVLGMCHHRRSREEGRQCCGGEKCSKFHSWYLLRKCNRKWSENSPHID